MTDRSLDLRAAIEKSGYYPDVVADARSDWYVRRLATQAGDTLHG